MKKNLSKLFAMALALIMVMALTVPAMAAGTGSITITNATVGETYAGYKIFDATYSGENVAYTIQFDSQFYEAVSTADDVFTLTESSVTGTYNVAVVQDADVLAWVKSLNIGDFEPDLPATEASSATVAWNSVSYGYYYITSSLGTLITVDSNLPDVEVIDKNQEPIPGDEFKSASDTTVQVGETTTFTVTFTTTNYDGETMITQYDVKDTMADTMEMVEDTLAVKVGDRLLTHGTDYTGTVSENGFDIDIKWYDSETKAFLYASPNTLTITYDAKLLATATVAGEGNVNTVEIGFNGTTKKTDTEKLYTYALAIQKVDKQGKPLANAKFTLMNGSTPVAVSGSDGQYVVDPEGKAEIVSPANGLIVIKGVDNDEYTLTEIAAPDGYNLLTEPLKVTPTATNETSTNITKYLDENGDVVMEETDTAVTITIADVAATPVVVVNFTGTELPSTGGMGTTLFYTIGGVLVVCAGVLLVTKKRMNNMEG